MKGKIVPVPLWLWVLFWILQLVSADNLLSVIGSGLVLGLTYSIYKD